MEYKKLRQNAINLLYKNRLSDTEENIGTIVKFMLLAKEKYKPEIGVYEAFLSMYIKFALKTIKTAENKRLNNREKDFSSFDEMFIKGFKVENRENSLFSDILESQLLNSREKDIILRMYQNGDKITQIASEFNLSKQAIYNIRNGALKKLRHFLSK
jgi:DNA-directed RNA polymerase specialized sigma subunit